MTGRTSEIIDTINQHACQFGLCAFGGFYPVSTDNLPPSPGECAVATVILLGNAGPRMWEVFERQQRVGDNPLDRWTTQVVHKVAAKVGAQGVVFPFVGPPFYPFQQWAERSGIAFPSPLGILIHPVFGLWHAYRGALFFSEKFELPVTTSPSPCKSCIEQPCLTSCPASAVKSTMFNFSACQNHLRANERSHCRQTGCQARQACPIGKHYAYTPTQASYHLYF